MKIRVYNKSIIVSVWTVLGALCTVHAESTPLFSYPVLEHNISEKNRDRLEQAVDSLMSLSDRELIALVPSQTPLIKNACPSCRAGKPYDKVWDNNTAKIFDYNWDYKTPNQIQCKTCQTIFPNKKFPLDWTDQFYNMADNPVEIQYYFDPDKTAYGFPGQVGDAKGRRYYLNGVIDYAKWNWLFPKLESLAQLYHLTKDEKYARPAVLILKQYSEYFQDYLLTKTYGHAYATTEDRDMPYGWAETRWGRRMPNENMLPLLDVVDLVYASKSMDQVSEESDTDIREKLWSVFESGLKRQLCLGYSSLFGQTAGAKDWLPLAKVFGKTDLIHLVFQTYYDLPRYSFSSDGSYFEGTGYAAIQNRSTAQLREEDGYSDPATYKGDDRLDNVYPFVSRETFYKKCYEFNSDLRYPDGRKVVIQDSCPLVSIFLSISPRPSSHNIMKPGYKHVVMGDGVGDDQVQVHIGFGENSANHSHQDTLGLQMYAFAHPLIDTFPYHKSKLRKFSQMTISHNTVVVDYQNQNAMYSDADPLLYVDNKPGLSVFSADGSRVYRDLTTKYKRTLVLNTVDLKHPYLIDIFQVAGGEIHDYLLKSSSQFPQSARTSLQMTKMKGLRPLLPPGEIWREPRAQGNSVGSGYGLLFDVKQAEAEPYFNIDFVCDTAWDVKQIPPDKNGKLDPHEKKYIPYRFDPESWTENAAVGMRTHIVGQLGQQVFLAQIPDLKRNGFYGKKGALAEDWEKMPLLVLRSEQQDKKSESLFVVIHEPIYKSVAIEGVRRIKFNDPNVLVLEIKFKDGRRDQFIYSLNLKPVTVKAADLEFSGILGLIATESSGKSDAYLIGGEVLKTADGKINLQAAYSYYEGDVISSSRKWDEDQKENSFTIQSSTDLPEGHALAGQWIILKHHGLWDAYKDRKSMRPFLQDHESKSWGLDDTRIWEAFYKDAKEESPIEQLQGGGYCFQISHIEKRKGQTIIHTTDDHGLIINKDSAKEYFYPLRHYMGKTTFKIYSIAATQTTPLVSPKGGAFMESVLVRCSVPEPGNKIMIAVTAPSALPDESDWLDYKKPFSIDKTVDLHVKSSAEGSFRDAQVYTYSFSAALKPVARPENLKSGLVRLTYIGKSSMEPGSLPSRMDVGNVITTKDLVKQLRRSIPGKLVFSGMLQVDNPGIYTFYYLADRDGIFRIGDKILLESQPQFDASPLARQVDVALKKGFYPLHFELYIKGDFNQWDPALKLEWSGPGQERKIIPLEQLWHDQKTVETAMSLLD